MGFTLPVGLFAGQSSSVPGDVLTGLVAAWNFESDFTDQVGSNDLTNTGSVAIAAGVVGNAAEFDGASSLSSATTADLEMGAVDFTISMIVVLGAGGSSAELLGKWTNIADPEYRITLDSDDTVYFQVQNPGTVSNSFVVLSVGSPYLVIAKHRASDGTISLRVLALGGVDDYRAEIPGISINAASTGTFRIGKGSVPYIPNGTLIDAVHIWKRYLSPADEELLINGGLGAEYPFT
jgi:hypothetical protein